MPDADHCAFCEIVAGRAPAKVIGSSQESVAIVPLNPVVPGHVIVIPRRHVADAAEYPAITAEVMYDAATLARDHQSANIITSIGAPATQTVFHLHIHVVPRREGDGLALPWTHTRHQSGSREEARDA